VHHKAPGNPVVITTLGLNMKKTALVVAALAAVCFTLSGAEAAKKKHAAPKKPADAAYEWNLKNIPPPPQAGAAGPAKKAAVHKKAKNAKKA
jgi:hypothetical protein